MKPSSILAAILVSLCNLSPRAALNDPFPMGYDMQTFGAILWENSASASQPWSPAAFLGDSAGFGASLAAVDYYGSMDNFGNRDIRQGGIGGWGVIGKLRLKAAYTHFNALDVYYEQQGYLSLGTTVIPFILVSAELSGLRIGLTGNAKESETTIQTGATVRIPMRYVSAALQVSTFTIANASQEGFAPPVKVALGVHTVRHRFGAQGVRISTTLESEPLIRLAIGEELWVHESVAVSIGLCSEPFMISAGVTVNITKTAISAAFVHHPELGWSKGMSGSYRIRAQSAH